MPRLFGRKLIVEFQSPNKTFSDSSIRDPNTTIIESLSEGKSSISAKFTVHKNLSAGTANMADFTFINLSAKTMQRLTRQKKGRLIALAGYEDSLDIIFVGDISRIRHTKIGTDWATNLSAGDGQNAIKSEPVSYSLPKGASIEDFLKAIGTDLLNNFGIETTAAQSELSKGNPNKPDSKVYAKGYCSMANVVTSLSEIAKRRGKSLSIQNSRCQINTPSQPTNPDKKIFIINARSGLISSSNSGEEGVINISTLMYPQILPGDAVKVESDAVEGEYYRVEDIVQRGDTRGREWYSDMTLKPLKTGVRTSVEAQRDLEIVRGPYADNVGQQSINPYADYVGQQSIDPFIDDVGLQSIDPSNLPGN